MSPYHIIATFPSDDTGKLFFFVSLGNCFSKSYISKSFTLLDLEGIILDEAQGSCHYSLFVNGYCDVGYYVTDCSLAWIINDSIKKKSRLGDLLIYLSLYFDMPL